MAEAMDPVKEATAPYRCKQAISFQKQGKTQVHEDRYMKLYDFYLTIYKSRGSLKEKTDINIHLGDITYIRLLPDSTIVIELATGSINIKPRKSSDKKTYKLHSCELLVEIGLAYRDVFLDLWYAEFFNRLKINENYNMDDVPWTLVETDQLTGTMTLSRATKRITTDKTPFAGMELLSAPSSPTNNSPIPSTLSESLRPAERQILYYITTTYPGARISPCGNLYTQYNYIKLLHMRNFTSAIHQCELRWKFERLYPGHNQSILDFSQFPLDSHDWLLRALKYNRHFTGLKFRNRTISPDFVQQLLTVLEKNPEIVLLNVTQCEFKGDSMRKFTTGISKCSVVGLYLTGVKIDMAAAQNLQLSLSSIETLETLSLSNCNLTSKAATAILSNLPTSVNNLDLSHNRIDAHALQPFFNKIEAGHLTTLDLSETDVQIIELVTYIGKSSAYHSLKKLYLDKLCVRKAAGLFSSQKPISPQQIEQISLMFQGTKLDTISLRNTHIPINILKKIVEGISSRYVDDNHRGWTRLLLAGMNILTSGQSMSLSQVFRPMQNVSKLQLSSILVDGNPINDNHFADLIKGLTNNEELRELDFSENLTSSPIKRPTAQALCSIMATNLNNLEVLNLQGMKLRQFSGFVVDTLNWHARLKELNLINTALTDVAFHQICIYLRTNCNLQKLYLDRNNAGCEEYRDLADVMAMNYTLQEIGTPVYDIKRIKDAQVVPFNQSWKLIEARLGRNRMAKKSSKDLYFAKEMSRSEDTLKDIKMMTNYLRRFPFEYDRKLLALQHKQSQRGVLLEHFFEDMSKNLVPDKKKIPGTALDPEIPIRQIIQQVMNVFTHKMHDVIGDNQAEYNDIVQELQDELGTKILPSFMKFQTEVQTIVENAYCCSAVDLHERYLGKLEEDLNHQLQDFDTRSFNPPALPAKHKSAIVSSSATSFGQTSPVHSNPSNPNTPKAQLRMSLPSGQNTTPARTVGSLGSSRDDLNDDGSSPEASGNRFARGGTERQSMKNFIRNRKIGPKKRPPGRRVAPSSEKPKVYEELEVADCSLNSGSADAEDEFEIRNSSQNSPMVAPVPAKRTHTKTNDRYVTYDDDDEAIFGAIDLRKTRKKHVYAYNDSGSESEIDNDPEDTMTRDARRRLTQANRDNRQNQMNIMQELAQMKFVK